MAFLEIQSGKKVYGNNLTGYITFYCLLSLSHSSFQLKKLFVVLCQNPRYTKAALYYSLRDSRSVLYEATNKLMCGYCFGKLIYVPWHGLQLNSNGDWSLIYCLDWRVASERRQAYNGDANLLYFWSPLNDLIAIDKKFCLLILACAQITLGFS